jgi:hypothetical protein
VTDEEFRLLAEIRALKTDYMKLQESSAWTDREHERAISAFQDAVDRLSDEVTDLTEQLADKQLVVDAAICQYERQQALLLCYEEAEIARMRAKTIPMFAMYPDLAERGQE